MEEYLTIGQAADYMQKPVETLRKWRSQGYGPKAARAGRSLLYRRSEIDRWIRSQEEEPIGRGP